MSIKNGLYLLSCVLLANLITSCLKDNTYIDKNITLSDAELISFRLSHDSVPELSIVYFSIDQINNTIYNHDSMTYLTNIREKVIVNYTSAAGIDNVLNITNGDSVWIKKGDSIDVTAPALLKVFALDGLITKTYTLKLNIHRIDPDSVQYIQTASGLSFLQTEEIKTAYLNDTIFVYSKINGEIQANSSSDAIHWEQKNLSGLPGNTLIKSIQYSKSGVYAFTEDGDLYISNDAVHWIKKEVGYPVNGILGYLYTSAIQTEGICLIVEKEEGPVFALYSPVSEILEQGESVPEKFPVKGFSTISYELMKLNRVTNVGGISADGEIQNTVWSTQNGLYWAKLTDNRFEFFPKMEGSNAFYYENEIWMINGYNPDFEKTSVSAANEEEDGEEKEINDGYNRKVYYSIDGGTTWRSKPEKFQAAGDFQVRYGANLVIDGKNKYFYIIGGKQQDNTILTDIYKGFINKKEFKP